VAVVLDTAARWECTLAFFKSARRTALGAILKLIACNITHGELWKIKSFEENADELWNLKLGSQLAIKRITLISYGCASFITNRNAP
jgi:hypothetical protein